MRQRRGLIIILLLALAAVGSLSLVIYLLSLSQPGDQSVAESVHNDRVCVIGWANSHMQVSTNGGGYIPYADLTASAPAGAQIKVIDLNSATNPVTTANFADIDM
ncbi:hypothetical protein KC640_03225, partial [Candidatus Dojkabacteria bacterium]|nr:hypothetical protein [Candidatus Dojkabacteria bacterium]